MLIQVWAPDISTGAEILDHVLNFGFYEMPDLAEWYHPDGCIVDISPAPVRRQECSD